MLDTTVALRAEVLDDIEDDPWDHSSKYGEDPVVAGSIRLLLDAYISMRLNELRKRHKCTIDELAVVARVPLSSMKRWIDVRGPMPASVLLLISVHFGVQASYFTEGCIDPQPSVSKLSFKSRVPRNFCEFLELNQH